MASYGWVFIDTDILSTIAGPTGSLQFRTSNSELSGTYSAMFATASSTTVIGATSSHYFDDYGHTFGSEVLHITGNVTISGTLEATQYHTNIVSSSIVHSSGSTRFGNSADDTHEFSGSTYMSSLGSDSQEVLRLNSHASSGGSSLIIDHNDVDVVAMQIDTANTVATALDIDANSITTAAVLDISAAGLTSGQAIRVRENSGDTSARQVFLLEQDNVAAINATALKVQSDGGKIGIQLDKNYESTNASTVVGLSVDLDKTGGSTTDNTIYGIEVDMDNATADAGQNTMIGISLTPTLTHNSDAGTAVTKGAQIVSTGGTNGTSTAFGLDVTTTGADTNIGISLTVDDGGTDIKLNSSADSGDYFKIETTTHGATTLTTVDDDAAAADLTMTIDGDIIVGPEGGDFRPSSDGTINLGTASYRWANLHTADLHLKNDRGDWTIIEEAEYLTVTNNLTGKRYKLLMEELEDDD